MFLMQIIMVVLMLVEFTLCASLTYHIFTATRCKNTRGSGIRHQWLEHDFHSTAPPSNENNIECHPCAEINIAYNYRDEQPPPYSEIHRTGPLLNETDIGCDPCVETNITDNYRDLSPPPYRL